MNDCRCQAACLAVLWYRFEIASVCAFVEWVAVTVGLYEFINVTTLHKFFYVMLCSHWLNKSFQIVVDLRFYALRDLIVVRNFWIFDQPFKECWRIVEDSNNFSWREINRCCLWFCNWNRNSTFFHQRWSTQFLIVYVQCLCNDKTNKFFIAFQKSRASWLGVLMRIA